MSNNDTSIILDQLCKNILDKLEINYQNYNYSEFISKYDYEEIEDLVTFFYNNNNELTEELAIRFLEFIKEICDCDFIRYIYDIANLKYNDESNLDNKKAIGKLIEAIDYLFKYGVNTSSEYQNLKLNKAERYYYMYSANKAGFKALNMIFEMYGLDKMTQLYNNNSSFYKELLEKSNGKVLKK